jgi:4'-phosphopantetheinyl transferase
VQAHDGARVGFNLSHSGDAVLYALASEREVGVDIELIRPELAYSRLAERFFTPREAAALEVLPAARRLEAFYVYWVLKEAVVKLAGDGLARLLKEVDVTQLARNLAKPEGWKVGMLQLDGMSIARLPTLSSHAAAVAVSGSIAQVRCWSWEGALRGS